MENRAITRAEAVELLAALIDTNMFAVELEDKLADIMNAIDNERYGLHLWGADNDEYMKLCTATRADLETDEHRAECERIWNKYSFVASPFEEAEIDESIAADDEE